MMMMMTTTFSSPSSLLVLVMSHLLLLLLFVKVSSSARAPSSSSQSQQQQQQPPLCSSSSSFADIARGGKAELLCCKPTLQSYFDADGDADTSSKKGKKQQLHLLQKLAEECRNSYLTTGIAHVPNFLVRKDIIQRMVEEAIELKDQNECFYSTEDHTVYQEPQDFTLADADADHPRNVLQKSSKWIIDYDRIIEKKSKKRTQQQSTKTTSKNIDDDDDDDDPSPLVLLYSSRELRAFVSYVVRPPQHVVPKSNPKPEQQQQREQQHEELFHSGCPYNAAYYNIYEDGDGLGWHFDRSDFGVNLELQIADGGGIFELCWKTRRTTTTDSSSSSNDDDDDPWCFEKIKSILNESTTTICNHESVQRIKNPKVGPGSLVIFAGSTNLHRVTPVKYTTTNTNTNNDSSKEERKRRQKPRINAIMTFERLPNQRPNAYSLRKFFGR